MDKKQKNKNHALSSSRLLIYVVLFIFTLFGMATYQFIQQNKAWIELDQEMDQVIFLAQKAALKNQKNQKIKESYQNVNSNYLQKTLEPLRLLEKEQLALTKLINSSGFCGNKTLEGRLYRITSAANQIKLKQQPLYTSSSFREVEVMLEHPVEVSLNDLETLLKTIEKEEKTKPLLQMTHFHLKRKKPIEQSEVFEVNFNILKREFLKS